MPPGAPADNADNTAVPAEPISAVAGLVAQHRPDSRRLRVLLALLAGAPMDLASLVQAAALPRQTVENVLSALGGDLTREGGTFRIAASRQPAYRQRFGYDQLARTELADPLGARLAGAAAIVRTMTALAAQAPAARPDLDHVPATPATVVRRALWLDSTYDLAGAVVLFVGDHDLTSLAVGQVSPEAELIVVDVDERTLEFIDEQASHLGIRVRCLAADLRFGLPERAAGRADLVFTDPPYTPEGLELFAARGLQGIGNRDHGPLVVAYGYSDRHPALGFQVQSAAHRLGLAYEAVLPRFNTYTGAQAVGSSSALYVWRPTARTWRTVDHLATEVAHGIYTRGAQAVEAPAVEAQAVEAQAVEAQAVEAQAVEAQGQGITGIPGDVVKVTESAGYPVSVVAGAPPEAGYQASRLRLATLITAGIPASVATVGHSAVADLSSDPGGWLLRALLAANASRVVLIVPSNHPDLANEAAQQSLAGLVRPKYRLRFLRNQPDTRHALVVADRADQEAPGGPDGLTRRVLTRAHGKVGNIWREALIDASRQHGNPLTKRDARALAEAHASQPHILDTRLIELPRHQIARLLDDVAASAEALS